MKAIRTRLTPRATLLALAAVLLLLGATGLSMADEPGYTLTRWTVDGGGVTNTTQGSYILSGAAGQPDAHVWSGEDYSLVGGFWASGVAQYRVYLPLVLRDY
jgi:hypothetical protein